VRCGNLSGDGREHSVGARRHVGRLLPPDAGPAAIDVSACQFATELAGGLARLDQGPHSTNHLSAGCDQVRRSGSRQGLAARKNLDRIGHNDQAFVDGAV
jgi:hypothetical protein